MRLLGRPPEVEGIVVSGDARGGTLGFPTANLRVDQRLLVPRFGIYAGESLEHRAAISIGVNPHYGGAERRVEAFLLDFEGDLTGGGSSSSSGSGCATRTRSSEQGAYPTDRGSGRRRRSGAKAAC